MTLDAAEIKGSMYPLWTFRMLNELSPDKKRKGKVFSSKLGIMLMKYLSMFF